MNTPWWHDRTEREPLGRGTGSTASADFRTSPATLLRRPPAFQEDGARRRRLVRVTRPTSLDCRTAGLTIGTARTQRGFVKQWRAKSVDLRALRLPPLRWPHAPAGTGPAQADAPYHDAPLAAARPHVPPRPLSRQELLARRLAIALQPPPEALLRAAGPLEWPGTLFPYQAEGVRALLASPYLLLGDDLGLGKTVQAIAALRILLHRREIERALVVVPASLLDQWHREITRWAPELRVMLVYGSAEDRLWQWQYRAHVTLTSYETLRADCTSSPQCGPRREPWGVVVLDEAQRIKNRDTAIARACRSLPRGRSWALTGTPLENRIQDTASILAFVRDDGSGRARPVPTYAPSLQAALRECQLRRRKADVLPDLPPKITTELLLPLTAGQRRAYDRVERDGRVKLHEVALREVAQAALAATESESAAVEPALAYVLDQITRLKVICNFAPEADGGASAKLEDLATRLEELTAEGHKALIFTQYTNDQFGARRIARGLQRFAPLLYTGDMNLGERNAAIRQFTETDDHRVLILSVQAGGQGLNLQSASYVFHFDRWWNPASERQAEGRAHRIGQTQPVHVYTYTMADTIEQQIDRVLKSKMQLFDKFIDETSLDLAQFLNKWDLYALVGLEPARPDSAAAPAAPPPLGLALEQHVAGLLARLGYEIQRIGAGHDGGVDVVAQRDDAVGARTRLYVQCKDTSRPVNVDIVRSLNGVLPQGERGVQGVVVCPAGFTPEARTFALARHIQLWDAAKLRELE